MVKFIDKIDSDKMTVRAAVFETIRETEIAAADAAQGGGGPGTPGGRADIIKMVRSLGAGGIPGLRDKSHRITREEILALASGGVEHVIVGIGWDGAAQVDPDALSIPNLEITVLLTPEAFAEFARLRAKGTKVALLAHSTC